MARRMLEINEPASERSCKTHRIPLWVPNWPSTAVVDVAEGGVEYSVVVLRDPDNI